MARRRTASAPVSASSESRRSPSAETGARARRGEIRARWVESRKHWLARGSVGYLLDSTGEPILDAKGKPKRDYKDFTSTDDDGREAVRKAEDWVAARQAERILYGQSLNRSLTCDQWFEVWMRDFQPLDANSGSRNADRSQYKNYASPEIGPTAVASVAPSDILRVWKRMDAAGRATTSKVRLYWTLVKMFGECENEHRIPSVMTRVRNPGRKGTGAQAKKAATKPAEERDAIEVQNVLRILAEAGDRDQGTKWWMSILQGLRQAERLGATWESLDLSGETGFYTVEWQLDEVRYVHGCGLQRLDGSWPCGELKAMRCTERSWDMTADEFKESRHLEGTWWLRPPKRDSYRSFPLVPRLRDALAAHRDKTKDEPNPYGLIWHRPDGKPWTASLDEREWYDVLLSAGVINVEQTKPKKLRAEGTPAPPGTHFARHTTVSVLQELGVSETVIMTITGHKQLSTLRGYTHVARRQAEEAMRKLGAHYEDTLSPVQ